MRDGAQAIAPEADVRRRRDRCPLTEVGFELVCLPSGRSRDVGFVRGPRLSFRLHDEAQVRRLFAGLMNAGIRHESSARGSTVGMLVDCGWGDLSTLLAATSVVRAAAAQAGMGFLVRANTDRMMVTVVTLEHDATPARLAVGGGTSTTA